MNDHSPSKKLHIKTYGCQMNVYDSERMVDILRPLGYEVSGEADGADLVLLNTCHIREKAAEKVYSEIGRLKELREENRAWRRAHDDCGCRLCGSGRRGGDHEPRPCR